LSNANDQITTGITAINRNPFEVHFYPNPAKERIYFSFANDIYRNETFRYTILNPVGQRLSTGITENNAIPLKNLSTGVYYIELLWKQNNKVLKKIVIE
jgi:hypothetical protein